MTELPPHACTDYSNEIKQVVKTEVDDLLMRIMRHFRGHVNPGQVFSELVTYVNNKCGKSGS